jgi:hypothetical protein
MADYQNFLGGSYVSQSPLADCERTVNWYPERVDTAGRRNALALYPTPGQVTYTTTADVGARGALTMASRTHMVMGGGVYEVFNTNSATKRGTVLQDNNLASITYNGSAGNRLCIASGGTLYYLNLSTNAVAATTGVTSALQVGMIDGFFVAFDSTTNRIYVSPLNDTTGTWDPTQFAQRSTQPDPWQAMIVVPPDIWLIGEQTGDVWYDAGTSPFPLAPRTGITFRYGTPAPFSVAAIGSSVLWLAKDANGAGTVVQTRGYSPQPISTKALETALSNYQRTSTISDAEALVYEQEGHTFYVLKFPSANATWAYDTTTQLWHERGTWNAPMSRYDAWHPRVHTYAFGQHLVGDSTSGAINTLDVTYGSEADGSAIRRLRIPPPLWVDTREGRMFISRFEPIFEPGLGTSSGQGLAPKAMLRVSTDTKTWSNERTASVGATGKYQTRTTFLRNGSSTLVWVPELTVSDPIPWRLVGAEIEARGIRRAA